MNYMRRVLGGILCQAQDGDLTVTTRDMDWHRFLGTI